MSRSRRNLNNSDLLRLNRENPDVTLEITPLTKEQKRAARAAQQFDEPRHRDQADTLAMHLEHAGIPCIFEKQYTELSRGGLYLPHCAVREFRFAMPDRQWRADFCWPAYRLIAEVDGGTQMVKMNRHTGQHFVAGRHAQDDDYWKTNEAARRGFRRLAFTTSMLSKDPRGCVQFIYAVLARSDHI